MGQVSERLRRVQDGYGHYCPGCEGMHVIPDTWTFDHNLDEPTFSPSVHITYNGSDAGQLREDHRAPAACCHYFLTAGHLHFCGDSTHSLAGQTVPLPVLPDWLKDWA